MKKLKIMFIGLIFLTPICTLHANIFKDAIHWVEKQGRKAYEWSKNAAKEVENAFSKYGSAAVDAVKDIGEKAWKKLKGVSSCADVVKYGTLYAEAEAAYQSSKAASFTIGPAAEKLGHLSSAAINKGVNIKKASFEAESKALFEKKGKVLDLNVQGTIFGQELGGENGIDLEVDFEQIKSTGDLAKKILNKAF